MQQAQTPHILWLCSEAAVGMRWAPWSQLPGFRISFLTDDLFLNAQVKYHVLLIFVSSTAGTPNMKIYCKTELYALYMYTKLFTFLSNIKA